MICLKASEAFPFQVFKKPSSSLLKLFLVLKVGLLLSPPIFIFYLYPLLGPTGFLAVAGFERNLPLLRSLPVAVDPREGAPSLDLNDQVNLACTGNLLFSRFPSEQLSCELSHTTASEIEKTWRVLPSVPLRALRTLSRPGSSHSEFRSSRDERCELKSGRLGNRMACLPCRKGRKASTPGSSDEAGWKTSSVGDERLAGGLG